MRIQKEKNRCFTLVELLMVIIILAMLVSAGIPIYNRTIEDVRGKADQNNMRTIFAAWRIYNMKGGTYDPGDNFNSVSQINTNLGTLIDERYFGQSGSASNYGFYVDHVAASNYLRLFTSRLSGIYINRRISCRYYYNDGTYNWNPSTWATNWPFSLTE